MLLVVGLLGVAAATLALLPWFTRDEPPSDQRARRALGPEGGTVMAAPLERRAVGGAVTFRPATDLPASVAQTGIPQAAPLAMLLWAAAFQDIDTLRGLYSQRIAQRIAEDRGGWAGHAASLQGNLARRCGTYDPAAWTFAFAGDDVAGLVTTTCHGERIAEMRVIHE
ncbi:MAG TPA: hypothetical protein VK348_10160, partial [Planctomycetota bacterium]|nr:hypothetical protein [Planctomycetota bacterium]